MSRSIGILCGLALGVLLFYNIQVVNHYQQTPGITNFQKAPERIAKELATLSHHWVEELIEKVLNEINHADDNVLEDNLNQMIISQDFDISTKEDVSLVLNKRISTLQDGCSWLRNAHGSDLKTNIQEIFMPISDFNYGSRTKLEVCAPPKVGSTSWKSLVNVLWHNSFLELGTQPAQILAVRHPLKRLVSAYRDKFLDGSQLWSYNTNLKNLTGSTQSFLARWNSYWLPALISSGEVNPSDTFYKAISNATSIIEKHHQNRKIFLKNREFKPSKFDDLQTLKYKYFLSMMLKTGSKSYGLRYAIDIGLENSEKIHIMKKYTNKSFSFLEFLKHVVWTFENGIEDQHWGVIAQLCHVCKSQGNVNLEDEEQTKSNFAYYSHVIKMEEGETEVRHLLDILGYKGLTLPFKHKSQSTDDGYKSWNEYYKDIPLNILKSIIRIYKYDFILFGYT